MKQLKVFIKERLPVIPNFILAFGLMFSAWGLSGAYFTWPALVFGVVALFAFVSELRFMDELKDVEKDIVANPDRPLPRGAISQTQVSQIIAVTWAVLVLLAIAAFFAFNNISALFFGISISWLFLMYHEFYVGEWLSSRPLLYAITHQIVILPLCLFAVALFSPEAAFSLDGLAFGFLVLSAFFSFEIGRKLDPAAHPILKTYLVVSGAKKVILYLVVLQVLALVCSYALGALWWVAPPAVLIFLTLPKLISKPGEFKNLEGLISLNLIYIVWVLAIKQLAETL